MKFLAPTKSLTPSPSKIEWFAPCKDPCIALYLPSNSPILALYFCEKDPIFGPIFLHDAA